MDMEFIKLPEVQLGIYLSYLVIVAAISRLDVALLIMNGVGIQLIWVPWALFAAVPPSVSWTYYLWLPVSVLLANAALWGVLWLGNRFGKAYNGEGSIALIAPAVVLVLCLALSGVIKLGWQLVV